MEEVREVRKRRRKGTGTFSAEQQRLKLAGKAYKTNKNQEKPEKKRPDAVATCKCNFECKTVSSENKQLLFDEFYKQDYNTQGTFLMGLIQVTNVRRRRHGLYETPEQSRRQCTVSFTVPDGKGNTVAVCKNIFMDIFAVTRKRLELLIRKKKLGQTTFKDERRRHAPSKFGQADRELVRSHVNSIPRDVSHYSRSKSTKEYLSSDLNISRIYRAFKEKNPASSVTQSFYRNVFMKDFPNLSFKRPRTDTCKQCDLLNCQIKLKTAESVLAKQKLELHQRKSEKARSLMKQDICMSQRPGSNICCISMDLQQVLFVPTLTHSDMFYLRQLSCFNFCIRIEDIGQSIICMWDESIANRGGNEISSCLLKMFNRGITDKRHIVIWSDNCCGQNKNRMMVFTLLFLVSSGCFETIEQKFLVSGHSFLSCDRDFAQIEKRKKVMKAFVPKDLIEVVKSAKVKTPFQCIEMGQHEFHNIQAAADQLINISKLNISKLVSIRYESKDPTVVKVKEVYSEDTWRTLKVLKKGKTVRDLRTAILGPAVNKPITEEKKQNLHAMINFLPNEEHKNYYLQICN